MDRSLWIAATGMKSQSQMTDSIAHNLANVNTNSYKRGSVHFQDLFYQNVAVAGSANASGELGTGIDFGYGSRVAGVTKNFTQGNLKASGGELSLAISGGGFFEVTMPNGDTAYTRDGAFHRNNAGQVVTHDGYLVVGFPNIPGNATQITISDDGTVSALVDGTSSNLGQLQLQRFNNQEGLRPIGNNLYSATDGSGAATAVTPGSDGAGFIRQGYLEGSNVEIVNEMVDMISSQRAFEIISKSIKSSEEMMRIVSNLKN